MRWMNWHKSRSEAKFKRTLWKDKTGTAAIEFAFVALPFFALVFATMEVGLAYVANRMVDNAVISASRLIRTGQAETENYTHDDIKYQICEYMPSFMCDIDRIVVEVTAVDSFSAAGSTDSLYDDDGNLREDDLGYDDGAAGSIIVVNVIYQWPMLVSSLGLDPADHDGIRYLTSTMVFRNEPFGDGVSG